jgi:hypothetical protein
VNRLVDTQPINCPSPTVRALLPRADPVSRLSLTPIDVGTVLDAADQQHLVTVEHPESDAVITAPRDMPAR